MVSADASRGSRDLGTLLRRSILGSAALATLLFALPLAFAVSGLYRAQAFAQLAREAERARAVVSDESLAADAAPLVLPRPRIHAVQVGVYDAAGRRVAGAGPASSEALVRNVARRGLEENALTGDTLVVGVPIPGDDGSEGYAVRAAESYAQLRYRTYLTWLTMAGLAALVLAVVAGVARARATRLARPLKELAAAADALGSGDFSVRATDAGVSEIDAVSRSLERTALRLGGMLERERAFSAEASHQMRTPLTAVRLSLESAMLTPGGDLRDAVQDALTSLDRLEQTVIDLIELARDTSSRGETTDVSEVVETVVRPWRRPLSERGRSVGVQIQPDLPRAAVSAGALRTSLDVLLGNALTHGDGRVLVDVRSMPDAVVVEVSDEGSGITGDPSRVFARRSSDARGTGIGLALARSLVEADGARLELVRAVPATFAVLLPAVRQTGPAEWHAAPGAAESGAGQPGVGSRDPDDRPATEAEARSGGSNR